MYNYQTWMSIVDPSQLFNILDEAIKISGYAVLQFTEHHFTPKGYTCLWLLAESHLAVHTFPEKNLSYIELSGCNKKKNEKFVEILEKSKLTFAHQ